MLVVKLQDILVIQGTEALEMYRLNCVKIAQNRLICYLQRMTIKLI